MPASDNVQSSIEHVIGTSAGDTISDPSGACTKNCNLFFRIFDGAGGDDTLSGGGFNDTLNGGDGNDTYAANAAEEGSDVFNGGNDTDTADYSSRSTAVKRATCPAPKT